MPATTVNFPPITARPQGSRGLAAFASNRIGNLSLPVRNEGDKIGAGLAGLGAGIAKGIEAKRARELEREKMAKADAIRRSEQEFRRDKFNFQKEKFNRVMEQEAKQIAAEESEQKIETAALASVMWNRMPQSDKKRYLPTYLKGLQRAGLIDEKAIERIKSSDNPVRDVDTLSKKTALNSVQAMRMLSEQQKKEQSGTTEHYDPETGKLIYRKIPLTTGAETQVQKDLKPSLILKQGMERIEELYDPRFLQWRQKWGRNLSILANKAEGIPGVEDFFNLGADTLQGMDKEEREIFNKKMTRFINTAEQVFQRYRKKITGAQASDREIRMLRGIFLNPDMGPREFRAAMQVLTEAAEDDVNLSYDQLVNGIRARVGSREQKQESVQQQEQEKILVINPNGQKGYIPASYKQQALKQGYKLVE